MSLNFQTRYIQKTFRLYFPQQQAAKIKQITIECEGCPVLNHELRLRSQCDLHDLKVSIPADKIEICNYRYSLVWKSTIIFRETVEKSKHFSINENILQRDIWIGSIQKPTRNHILNGIYTHLNDIIFNDKTNIGLYDSCQQIEDACKETLLNDEAKDVMMKLYKDIYDTDPSKIRLLFLVAAGKLLHNPEQISSETVLCIVSAQRMVDAAQEFCLDQIPESCRTRTQLIYLQVRSIIDWQNRSLLKCITKGFDFFDDIFILEQVLECVKSEQPLCETDETSVGIANSLCTRLYHEAISKNSVTAGQILEILLRNLPLRCSVSAFVALQRKDTELPQNDSYVQTQLYDIITVRIDVFLTEIKKSKTVQRLVTGWNDIIDTKGIEVQLLAPKFEDALLFVLGSKSIQNDNIPKLLSCCIEKYGLFQDESKLHTLLEVITKSQVTEVLDTFFLLSESSKTSSVYSTLSSEDINSLCYNLLADGARFCKTTDEKIKHTCTCLSKVWNVLQIKTRSEYVLILKDFLVNEFEKFRLEELLTNVEFMEELSGENGYISNVFEEYFSSLIKGKSDLTVEKVLNWFPKTRGGQRTADSRLTAELVCILLEVNDCAEETTVSQHFLRLVSKYKFWLSVICMKGKHMDIVRDNRSFCRMIECIENMVHLFRTHSVRCDFVECLEKNTVDAKGAKLLLAQKCKTTDIDKFWKEALSKFKEVKEKLILVHKVLSKVADVTKDMPPIFQDIVHRVEDTQHNLSSGKLTTKECLSDDFIWKGLNKLPSICKYLEPLITSSVFWNVCLENVVAYFNLEIQKQVEDDDPLHSPSILFQQMSVSELLTTTTDKNSLCILFMSILHKTGCEMYGNIWNTLLKEEKFPIQWLDTMFGKSPDINAELEIARKTLHIVIDESDENTLKRIFSIDGVVKTVNAIKAVAKVFCNNQLNDPELSSAMNAFQRLINGKASNYSFKAVKAALNTVYSLDEKLSEETVIVMTSLGNSSTLIKFLKSIVDEDIKNLIDAVEDMSEQQVMVSTVSALIEVKQYLHPLLLSQGCRDCRSILHVLENQTNAHRKHAGSLPQKIEDCAHNLHSLKSLYNGVANRGEKTKEMIKNIISRGDFQFVLNKVYTGVDFEVTYKQNRSKQIHKKNTLIDLRSRALLLINTEITNPDNSKFEREWLLHFIEDVDLCLDISEILFALHMSGHIEYMNIKEHISPKELQTTKESFSLKLGLWLRDVNKERCDHYLLNFIQGNQLHSLYEFLEQRNEDGQVVQTILSFIHPKLQAPLLKKLYQQEKSKSTNWSNGTMLHCIGNSLHSALKEVGKCYRPISDHKTKNLSSVVKPGKLSVVQLEEGSLHTVRTLLALFLNTTERLPEPNHVLFCTRDTSVMELELLIHRCLGAKKFYGEKTLFCIANVDVLPNEVQFDLFETLRYLNKETNFLLAIIYRGSRNHPFLDELGGCVTSVTPATEKTVRDIFRVHCSDVVFVSSDIPGLGKTSYIKKVSHQRQKSIVTLHISGPIRKIKLVERINALRVKHFHLLHIDIGNVDDPSELDTFLFELVVLHYVSAGRMSVSLQVLDVYIEISNTINGTLKNSLQTAVLFHRENLNWNGINSLVISKETNSPVQIVCRYLKELERHALDTTDILIRSDLQKPLSSKKCKSLLKKYVPDKIDCSYPILDSFIYVLADQFKKMSESSFFKVNNLKNMIVQRSVKTQLVQAMIQASSDFATRSIDVCREGQLSAINLDIEKQNRCTGTSLQRSILATCVANRAKDMVRWEESNHLMFVFHNQNIHTLSPLYRHLSKVPVEIRSLFEGQIKKPLENFREMDQWKLLNILQKIARVNPMSVPTKTISALSKAYTITADNLLKMVLIILRIKANIPVIIMGETGCGKTSLVRYLAAICEVVFDVMNVHAGILEEDIIERVLKNNSQALKDVDSEVWFFLDEINTSDSIGLIGDIICHHKCLGKELSPNLVIMGACNPYKLRTKEAIYTAGLDGKAKTDELSRLVYRVLPLPEMMVDFVWDFGSLSEKDEREYIRRMIADVFPPENSKHHQLFSTLLTVSQAFVRKIERSSYSVSLRDVQRCKLLTNWFLLFLPKKKPIHTISNLCDINVKSMILALAHCYQSRFNDNIARRDYRFEIGNAFRKHGHVFHGGQEIFIQNVIREEQVDILSRMKLPPGTACNTALRENVFIILVCIFNRIPIFVVGKPGCSKSLAMQLIKSNLRGKDSADEFFRELPHLYCVSFQGSESSTSDGIIKVFAKAKNYQNANDQEEVLSVVVLDEIGLAEISRFNPLKVLHNLLEPDGNSLPDVAVVGISNWALDASKMNRAVYLSRPDMDEEELFDTAISISESFLEKEEKENKSLLSPIVYKKHTSANTCNIRDELKGMSKAYYQYIRQLRFKNFHGLRDYYSLIKFVTRTFAEHGYTESKEIKTAMIINGIARNFGGLPDEIEILYNVFQQHLPLVSLKETPVMDLITDNIQDPIARHLMLITTGESVLGFIEERLKAIGCDRKETIFGSQFEEDLTEDYNYRILSRIILCMEEGMVLILKDLDNIYGSLYDMLNQNYTFIGNKKNCRVALGPYSNPICHVAETFRCIVLVDKRRLDFTDPPFFNRFEKQYLRFFDIIQEKHFSVICRLDEWIDELAITGRNKVDKEELFPVFNNDLTASLVLKVENDITLRRQSSYTNEEILAECKTLLLRIMKPEIVIRQKLADGLEKHGLSDEMVRQYFDLPIHNGLQFFIHHQIETSCKEELNDGLLNVVFTSSNVHSKIARALSSDQVQVEKLGTFKSEKTLSFRIQQFWNNSENRILVIQCSAKNDERHILLTKLVIERYRSEYRNKCISFSKPKHVYLVIHVNRSKASPNSVPQLNFLSEWKLVMIDSIECPHIPLPKLHNMTLPEAVLGRRPLKSHLQDELFWAYSKIRYGSHGRDVTSISEAITNIEHSTDLLEILENEILSHVKKQSYGRYGKYWQLDVACDNTVLTSSSSFVDALELCIMDTIKLLLVKFIYKIEQTGILNSILTCQHNGLLLKENGVRSKVKAWIFGIHDEHLFSIADVPDETGPGCYTCETVDFSLKMPFSLYIFESIESTKEHFMKTLQLYRIQCLLASDDDTPPDLYDAVLRQQENIILCKLPDLNSFTYENWHSDYIDDFCRITEHTILLNTVQMSETNVLKLILERLGLPSFSDPFSFVLRLHTMVWVHYESIRSKLLLTGKCLIIMPESKSEIIEVLKGFECTTDPQARENTMQSQISSSEAQCGDDKELVQTVCMHMLPTSQCLKQHKSINHWLSDVSSIISIAAKVSRFPSLLYSLRVCTELVAYLILPLSLDVSLIEDLGDVIVKGSRLDSSDVYAAVLDIIESALSTTGSCIEGIDFVCQRTLSSYFVRCISAHSDSLAFHFLFKLILESKISIQYVRLYKVPVSLFLQNVNEEFFTNILSTDLLDKKDENKKCPTEPEKDITMNEWSKAFLSKLDEFLKKLNQDSKQDHGFIILLTDLLQDIYAKEFPDLYCESKDIDYESEQRKQTVFFKCHKTLQEHSGGLKRVASICFCKCFIQSAAFRLQFADEKAICSSLDVALANISKKKHHKLTEVFLKTLVSSTTIIKLQRFCIEQGETHSFLKSLVWEERNSVRIFDKSPLCVHIGDMSLHNECLCCINMDINTFKREMIEQVKNAKTNIYATLQMLSFIMSQFYLQLSDSDLDDTRRREAKLLHSMIVEANYSTELKTLANCMLGERNFNITWFELTNNTPLLHVSEVSVLASLYSLLLSHFEFMVEHERPLPVLVRCLVAPENRFLPGWTNNDDSCIDTNNNDKMNPVTRHLLQFLINGCLLGSIALGFSSETVIADILSVKKNGIENHLAGTLDSQWKALKMCLNTDDHDLKALIHVIFQKAEKQICCNRNSCETVQEKKDWENSFEQEILPVVSKRYNNIKTVLRKHNHIHKKNVETVNKHLFETDDISSLKDKDNVDLPALYRIRSRPSRSNFVFELFTVKQQFPLLWDILQNEKMLKLPVHISDMIQWHNATVANASYMLKRHDCLEMTVNKFIDFKQKDMKKNVMKTRFSEFTKSWEILRSSMKNMELSKHMTRIHGESKMSDVLILGEESITFKVLQALIKIQNGFLDNIFKLANNCKGLTLFEKDGAFIISVVEAAEVKKEELLKCDIDWETVLKQESQCDFEYGCGKHIHYDFLNIEEIVLYKVITGKKYIISENTLPTIIFVDELHRNYASLIKELRTNVSQRPLPLDVILRLKRRKDEDPSIWKELLKHLGIVMTVLRKTGGDPDEILDEYVDRWQSIMCRNFPKDLFRSLESNIKLCHIVAISEVLEELSADSVKEGLEDKYREEISKPMWDCVLMQLKDEKLFLIVCKALKRFVYRCLSSKTADPKQVIRVYLSDASFWPMGMFGNEVLVMAGKTVHLKDILPDELKACHIYHFLTLIETETERQDNKTSGYGTSFRAKETNEAKSAQSRRLIVTARVF